MCWRVRVSLQADFACFGLCSLLEWAAHKPERHYTSPKRGSASQSTCTFNHASEAKLVALILADAQDDGFAAIPVNP